MLVTATVTDPARLDAARQAVDHLAPTARIALRPVYGSQDSRVRRRAAARPRPAQPSACAHRTPGLAVIARKKTSSKKPATPTVPPARAARLAGPRRRRVALRPGAGRVARHDRAGLRAVAVRRRHRLADGRRPDRPQPALGRDAVRGPDLLVPARASLISNPSMFVLGKAGLGKSSLVRRMALGLTGYGVLPMVLGDLKPDYVDLIRALDGQVIELGRGRGRLNILDPGEAIAAADRLTGQARARSSPTRAAAGTRWSRR